MTTYFKFKIYYSIDDNCFYLSFFRQINDSHSMEFTLTYDKLFLWNVNDINYNKYAIKKSDSKYAKIVFSSNKLGKLFLEECMMPQMIAINLTNENVKFKF